VGRRGPGAEPRTHGHHVAILPPDESPRLRIGGWHGWAPPLVPPGRRDVVIGDLHRRLLGGAGEGGALLLYRSRFRLHRHGRELLLQRGDLRLRQRLRDRGRQMRLSSRRRRERHHDRRRWLHLHHRPCFGHGQLLPRLHRRLSRVLVYL
jgi:hypothetical protein